VGLAHLTPRIYRDRVCIRSVNGSLDSSGSSGLTGAAGSLDQVGGISQCGTGTSGPSVVWL
jgi:hypothetical protein